MHDNIQHYPLLIGARAAVANTLESIYLKTKSEKVLEQFGNCKNLYWQSIKRLLYQKLELTFAKYDNKWAIGEFVPNSPIFVFWYQGIDNAPPIVKVCYDSIIRHSNGHPVILVTKDNLRNLVDLPDYIYEKTAKTKYPVTMLSDVLRFALLEKYGGLWCDATIFTTKDIDEDIFKKPYFTIKPVRPSSHHSKKFIGQDHWCIFCFGGYKESSLFSAMKELLFEYWKHFDILLDYFLTDIMMFSLYARNSKMRDLVSSGSTGYEYTYFLEYSLENLFNESFVKEYYDHEPTFSKLTYKLDLNKMMKNSVYDMLISTGGKCLEKVNET